MERLESTVMYTVHLHVYIKVYVHEVANSIAMGHMPYTICTCMFLYFVELVRNIEKSF